ncbi:hypothetical protein AB837_00413 [bacterium AB1]|nr:hypothetical protein AB837_00413 [bacterium AB1]
MVQLFQKNAHHKNISQIRMQTHKKLETSSYDQIRQKKECLENINKYLMQFKKNTKQKQETIDIIKNSLKSNKETLFPELTEEQITEKILEIVSFMEEDFEPYLQYKQRIRSIMSVEFEEEDKKEAPSPQKEINRACMINALDFIFNEYQHTPLKSELDLNIFEQKIKDIANQFNIKVHKITLNSMVFLAKNISKYSDIIVQEKLYYIFGLSKANTLESFKKLATPREFSQFYEAYTPIRNISDIHFSANFIKQLTKFINSYANQYTKNDIIIFLNTHLSNQKLINKHQQNIIINMISTLLNNVNNTCIKLQEKDIFYLFEYTDFQLSKLLKMDQACNFSHLIN